MAIRQQQRTELGTSLRVDPKLILNSHLLQLSQPELRQAVDSELVENPALDRLVDEEDHPTDEELLKHIAPHELGPRSEDGEFWRSVPQDESLGDWTDFAASKPRLADHLIGQLSAQFSSEFDETIEFVVGSLDDKGYLAMPVEEIALCLEESIERVQEVITKLRRCEPAGVGAADLQDCLLLQLAHADTLETRLARVILRNYMEDFLANRNSRIMRKMSVTPEVVDAAFAEILALNPHPAEGFRVGSASVPEKRGAAVQPDVIFCHSEYGWTVDVCGPDPTNLTVDREYRRRYHEVLQGKSAAKDEKSHVTEYVQRAARFIQAIHQRHRTLRTIANYLLENQQSFIATGQYQFLRDLTRSRLAKETGLHESTVSRATMDKFVQIGNGEIVPFEVFFKPALRIQKMIEEILQTENPNRPFSDEQIASMLAEKGIHVARRTVNKYRDRTKLLSSRKRKSA